MQPTPIAPFLKQQWQLTGFDGDVSQLENSSQNAKNVVLLLLGEPEEPEGVLGRGELGSVVDAVDQRVLALGQVPELKKVGVLESDLNLFKCLLTLVTSGQNKLLVLAWDRY